MRLAVLLGVFLTLSSVHGSVRAQAAVEDLDRNADAVSRGQRGLAAFGSGDLEASYRLFESAEELAHSPVFLLYMARVRAKQGALEDALALYERVCSEPLAETSPEVFRAAVEHAQEEAKEIRAARDAHVEVADDAAPTPEVRAPEAAPSRSMDRSTPRSSTKAEPTRRAAHVALGVSAVSALVGVGTGLVALLRFRPVKGRCTPAGCDPADAKIIADVQAWGRASDVSFALAGAGLATAGILFWVAPSASPGAAAPSASFGVLGTGRF